MGISFEWAQKNHSEEWFWIEGKYSVLGRGLFLLFCGFIVR